MLELALGVAYMKDAVLETYSTFFVVFAVYDNYHII